MRIIISARGHGHAQLVAAGLGLRRAEWSYLNPDMPETHKVLRGPSRPLVILASNGELRGDVMLEEAVLICWGTIVTAEQARQVLAALSQAQSA